MTHATRWAPTSFGAHARAYDRLRPGYPLEALTQALGESAEDRRGEALDVGCGTGKLAAALDTLGHRVTGLEPDPRMAAVAAAKGLAVDVAAFEEWDPAERRFDVVACGQAWHWLRPGERVDRAARCLRPGGRILLAWNFSALPPAVTADLTEVYVSVLPQGLPTGEGGRQTLAESDLDAYVQELHAHGFPHVRRAVVPWQATLTSRQWCGLLATDSRHLALPKASRRRLWHETARCLDTAHDGRVPVTYRCVALGASAGD
ncbi:class I SAM-dependent methyltransferase [Streptomyces coacervatus]|uniref:Class I SAM-dependent methyltransferase n=1 Tax=Streptomyces coacervatus TaxID=647381 RepID=A0ABP7H2X3_9ACTN|nr:class I SAM-dependent methyltransferase [Streptomyces coacervatus]MDF2268283.1 class I SAM-dependent methyltransferase [Streptomyces coacervatus]